MANPGLLGLDELCTTLSSIALSTEEHSLLLAEAEKLVGILRGRRPGNASAAACGLTALNAHALQTIALATCTDEIDDSHTGGLRMNGTKDLLCMALTCRELRDAVLALLPLDTEWNGPRLQTAPRLRTLVAMGAASVARLELALSLGLTDENLNHWNEPLDLTALCVEAAAFGRRDVLERAVEEGVTCRQELKSTDDDDYMPVSPLLCTRVLQGAAWGGQLSTMQWLVGTQWDQLTTQLFDGDTMGAAVDAQCREAITWLRGEGCEWDGFEDGRVLVGSTLDSALDGYCLIGPFKGQRPVDLSFVRWLRELGAPWSKSSLSKLIGCPHVDMTTLQWAQADGCPMSKKWRYEPGTREGIAAASNGRIDILAWLDAQDGLPRSKALCEAAAREGHQEALVWLRSRGCRWGPSTVTRAAKGDHVTLVQWAVANGCPWCPTVVAEVAVHGYQHADTGTDINAPRVVEWLRGQGHRQVDWSAEEWVAHQNRSRFNAQVHEQIKDETRRRAQAQEQEDDDNSDLGSADGGDSADDGSVFDDDASSVDSVEATTPGPGDFYEQVLPGNHGNVYD